MKIEVRAACGGDDAKLFMKDLSNTYEKYLSAKGWKYNITASDAMVVIETRQNIQQFINEVGSHRIMRVPPTEKRGRVHTSTITVSVLTQDKIETVYDKRSDGDFSYRWFSGTGKGGQHRNRHMCCLELTHIPSGLTQIANGRSRETNAQQALRDINQKLDDIQRGETRNDTNQVRVNQIGSGTRGDRRRTYRFGEDKIIDHLTGKQTSCKMFMRGDIERLW